EGDFGAARSLYAESLALYRELGDKRQIACDLNNLGLVALHERDSRRAAQFSREALLQAVELSHRFYIASILASLAAALAVRDEPGVAAQLFGAADGQLAALGARLEGADRNAIEPPIQAARSALSPAAWDAAYAAGHAMALDDAVAYALEQTADD